MKQHILAITTAFHSKQENEHTWQAMATSLQTWQNALETDPNVDQSHLETAVLAVKGYIIQSVCTPSHPLQLYSISLIIF